MTTYRQRVPDGVSLRRDGCEVTIVNYHTSRAGSYCWGIRFKNHEGYFVVPGINIGMDDPLRVAAWCLLNPDKVVK